MKIPLTSLEDWYVIYQLIPNRSAKVSLIEGYLRSNGIKRADLLRRMLAQKLPPEVKENIAGMLDLQ